MSRLLQSASLTPRAVNDPLALRAMSFAMLGVPIRFQGADLTPDQERRLRIGAAENQSSEMYGAARALLTLTRGAPPSITLEGAGLDAVARKRLTRLVEIAIPGMHSADWPGPILGKRARWLARFFCESILVGEPA